jgi:hypothetical protein
VFDLRRVVVEVGGERVYSSLPPSGAPDEADATPSFDPRRIRVESVKAATG